MDMPVPKPKIYGTATMNEKGQVVIPAEARIDLDMKPGMRFLVMQTPIKGAVIVIKAEEVEEHIKDLEK